MSKKDTLLKEATVRRFMKLANIDRLSDGHVQRLSEAGMYDEDAMEEGMYDEDMLEQEGEDEPTEP